MKIIEQSHEILRYDSLELIEQSGRPHPQMQSLMLPLLREFKQLVPVIFDDLEEK